MATDLILCVAVTQFQTEQVLKWLAERLVEVEMRQFGVGCQHTSDRLVNTDDGFLGHFSITMTCCLQATVTYMCYHTAQLSHNQACSLYVSLIN